MPTAGENPQPESSISELAQKHADAAAALNQAITQSTEAEKGTLAGSNRILAAAVKLAGEAAGQGPNTPAEVEAQAGANLARAGFPIPDGASPAAALAFGITSDKILRVDLDKALQRLKSLPASRERSLSITKIQEAIMWLGMDLKRLNDTRPYPSSYDPSTTKVEPTADGLKL